MPRSRSRKSVAAISLAGFLALFGYEAARMHNGDDPALARSTQKSSTTQTSSPSGSTSQSQSQGSSNGYDDGYGDDGYGGSAQDYYSPPQSDTPSTGSS
jgi:hypothetical protein